MEEIVALDPVNVGPFGTGSIVLETEGMAHLAKEFRRAGLHSRTSGEAWTDRCMIDQSPCLPYTADCRRGNKGTSNWRIARTFYFVKCEAFPSQKSIR
jgi:hypothetical protein